MSDSFYINFWLSRLFRITVYLGKTLAKGLEQLHRSFNADPSEDYFLEYGRFFMKHAQPGFGICIDSYVWDTYVPLINLNRFVFNNRGCLNTLISSECEMIGCTQSFGLVALETDRHRSDKDSNGRQPDAVTYALYLFMRESL